MPISNELWNERTDRLAKLIKLKAPRIIIVDNCLLVLHHFGMFTALRWWFKTHYWVHWKTTVWLFWNKRVLRLNDQEIDIKILEDE